VVASARVELDAMGKSKQAASENSLICEYSCMRFAGWTSVEAALTRAAY
jgi:hypothetical protein